LLKFTALAEILFTCYLTKLHPMDKEANGAKIGGGKTQWTSTQSSYVLTFLANLVVDGTKTYIGFRKPQLNSCAKALNDHFKLNRTSEQIANHLKTWKKIYVRINYLRNLSAAGWDEDNFIVYFHHGHYTNHMEV
jgi:hypothetical protein